MISLSDDWLFSDEFSDTLLFYAWLCFFVRESDFRHFRSPLYGYGMLDRLFLLVLLLWLLLLLRIGRFLSSYAYPYYSSSMYMLDSLRLFLFLNEYTSWNLLSFSFYDCIVF